jgi:hypothetical protein
VKFFYKGIRSYYFNGSSKGGWRNLISAGYWGNSEPIHDIQKIVLVYTTTEYIDITDLPFVLSFGNDVNATTGKLTGKASTPARQNDPGTTSPYVLTLVYTPSDMGINHFSITPSKQIAIVSLNIFYSCLNYAVAVSSDPTQATDGGISGSPITVVPISIPGSYSTLP